MNDCLNRAACFHGLLASLGKVVKAHDLVVTCEMFRRAWHPARHLLRPLAEYRKVEV